MKEILRQGDTNMKTKEELNALKEEVKTMNKKLHELTEEELGFVVGGGYGYYKVKYGETLADIARHLGVSQTTLISLNNIPNPDLIYAGQTLKYPC